MNTRLYTWIINSMLVASVVALVAASVSCIAPRYPSHARGLEARAKSTLRAFGETELAYQNTNNNRDWGTFGNLLMTDYIAPSYTRGNMVENYSLWVGVLNLPPIGCGGIESSFTVVAFPRTTRPPGYLHTFAIREDQVLRMYSPGIGNAWGMNDDFGTRTWETVR